MIVLPSDKRTAEDARKLVAVMSNHLGICYSELGRYQDGFREALGRVYECMDSAASTMETLRSLVNSLR
jgi:hypothetical protein